MKKILHYVLKNSADDVSTALAQGVSPNEIDRSGRTALMHAILSKNAKIVRLLLDANADVRAADGDGNTALHFAAQEYLPEIAEWLIRQGAVVDAEDIYGNTPLARAVFASRGRGDVIAVLLHAGAERNRANKYGVSPLSLAQTIANYDVSKFLVPNA